MPGQGRGCRGEGSPAGKVREEGTAHFPARTPLSGAAEGREAAPGPAPQSGGRRRMRALGGAVTAGPFTPATGRGGGGGGGGRVVSVSGGQWRWSGSAMGTQGAGRKRLPNRERLTAEDDALNQIAREVSGDLPPFFPPLRPPLPSLDSPNRRARAPGQRAQRRFKGRLMNRRIKPRSSRPGPCS